MRNERHWSKCYVPLTFYDPIQSLKQEEHRLLRSGQKVSAADIAKDFDGFAEAKWSTIKQAAATAARLSENLISVIGEIMNSGHSSLCMKTASLNTDGAEPVEEFRKSGLWSIA